MKYKFLWISAALLLVVAIYYIKHPLAVRVQIDGHVFVVDVAVTNQEKELGLGNRDYMPPDHGMLFVYDHVEAYSYWMKGMRFPLDMVWIKDKTIVDITKNIPVSVNGSLPIYTPKVPVDKVLELNAGTSDTYQIKPGDTLLITF
ncbi:MAG TPA: DUF192 domain-containing protein [Patescibacteria group bacterium]|jgi:hypothetical protein|nr:DUF192 domain-containing protein [Patescibacteria group bacterium]